MCFPLHALLMLPPCMPWTSWKRFTKSLLTVQKFLEGSSVQRHRHMVGGFLVNCKCLYCDPSLWNSENSSWGFPDGKVCLAGASGVPDLRPCCYCFFLMWISQLERFPDRVHINISDLSSTWHGISFRKHARVSGLEDHPHCPPPCANEQWF